MIKNNRKGFTITELVIVIAVIAILAAVLIPTFSGVITKANESAALQEARNINTEYLAEINYAAGDEAGDYYIQVDDFWFEVNDGTLSAEPVNEPTTGLKLTEDSKTSLVCVAACVDANTDGKCDICGAAAPANP